MGSFVYGLYDKDGLFYIGKTTNARKRFSKYQDKMSNPAVKKRLSVSGDDVRLEVLVLNPEDLSKAESDLILVNSGKILNKYYNRLPLCIVCGKVMEKNTSIHRKLMHSYCGGK